MASLPTLEIYFDQLFTILQRVMHASKFTSRQVSVLQEHIKYMLPWQPGIFAIFVISQIVHRSMFYNTATFDAVIIFYTSFTWAYGRIDKAQTRTVHFTEI